MSQPILIEGYTLKEFLDLSDVEIDAWILPDNPIVFKVGTAEILGKIEMSHTSLIIELAQIYGGGEGILRTIGILARKTAQKRNLKYVEWIIHSLDCADPNPKLNPMLERSGFSITDVPNKGKAYYRKMQV
ncbi:MAG: hypothetical protein AAFV93_10115 [Chloroflexota bacterium]